MRSFKPLRTTVADFHELAEVIASLNHYLQDLDAAIKRITDGQKPNAMGETLGD